MFNHGSLEGIYDLYSCDRADISLVQVGPWPWVVRPKFAVVQTMKFYSALHTPEEILAV